MNQHVKSVLKSIIPIILILIAAYFIVPISMPIILAFLTALILDSLVIFIMKTFKCSRRISVTILHVVFFTFSFLILYFSVNILLRQLIALSKALPEHLNTLFLLYIEMQTKIFNWTSGWPIEVVEMLQTSLQQQLTNFTNWLTKITELDRYSSIIMATPDVILILFIFFTVLYLVQIQLPALKKKCMDPLKPAVAKKVAIVSGELKVAIWGFFKAQLLISSIVFIVSLLALFFILPKYAILLTIGITIIDSIPFLDSFILLGPLALVIFAAGNTRLALLILLLGIVLLLIRRLLEPKLLGNQLNLPTLPTVIAMFIGLELFGIIGLLAGPLVVILIRSLIQQKLIHW